MKNLLLFYVLAAIVLLAFLGTIACAKQAPTPVPAPIPSSPPSPQPAAPMLKEVELKYDDGEFRDCIAFPGGFIVDFIPPSVPFTVNKIRVYGALYGSERPKKDFDVEIWNKSYKILWSSSYPIDKFQTGNPSWVDFDVPAIQVSDKFFVHVYTGTGRLQGIHIGADDSVTNLHSGITLRTKDGTTRIGFSSWIRAGGMWFEDREKVNWMVRVTGAFDASVPSQTKSSPAEIVPVVQIDTANRTKRELATREALEKLLAQYDVSKWIFTKSVMIEEGVIPHSHPVLTLSTAYLSYDYLNLSTFVHEQIHWFLSGRDDKLSYAVRDLRTLYPKVPVDNTGFQSDRTEEETYAHLIVCYLEYSAMKKLVNEETARLVMQRQGHYIWIYETVLSDTDKIEQIARKYDLIIE